MTRGTGILLVVAAAMSLALVVPRVREALAGLELFRVSEVEVEGNRYLGPEEAVGLLGLAEDANVWDDLTALGLRMQGHPMIRDARIGRRLPGTLVVELEEREPVALLPAPALTPVDGDGRILPIDPVEHRLDLPLLQPRQEPFPEGEPITPRQVRILTEEILRLEALDPALLASLSDAAIDRWGGVLLRLENPTVTLRYRPPLTPDQLRDGLSVLADAVGRHPERRPTTVDLRFEDQVVVAFSGTTTLAHGRSP